MVLLLRLEKTASGLGLFAEEYDPRWRELLGNFPQAFSHIASAAPGRPQDGAPPPG